MLITKFVSAMEKCFLDQRPEEFAEVKKLRMYKNERASIQLVTYDGDEAETAIRFARAELSGELSKFVTMHTVESVINYLPAFGTAGVIEAADPTYLRTTPGMYPDILLPLMRKGLGIPILNQQLHSVVLDIEGDLAAGTYPLTLSLYSAPTPDLTDESELMAENTIEIEVIDAELPPQELRYTNWFYADGLANYYNVEPFSDRHFEICENFVKTAVKNGINMILTPVFTPPLDTGIGWERTTTQLVKVIRENGVYSFDFSLLDRWIDMLNRQGVKYIEISHLFTQWGAYAAPKVMATVDGEYKKLFGWDDSASGEEYVTFIRAFLTELTAHLEARGDKERTYFHISDEPQGQHLAQYKTNKHNVANILKGWKLLDALSEVEFYKEGLCEIPVPSTGAIESFMPEDIKERWTYYCCGPWIKASNRLMAMSLARTRSIGMQLYKYGIEGFLHWGYNFYNNCHSYDAVNPFINAVAGYWCCGGDAHVVYPAQDGTPLESIRIKAIKQGIDDMRVMKLAESYYGKEAVVAAIESVMGELNFMTCANDSATMQKVRDAIDDMIIAKL